MCTSKNDINYAYNIIGNLCGISNVVTTKVADVRMECDIEITHIQLRFICSSKMVSNRPQLYFSISH